jgi:hypothetical protein
VVRSANNNGRARARAVRVSISAVAEFKRALVRDGDIAGDIAFQNDVNALLAAVARLSAPTPTIEEARALAELERPPEPQARVTPLRRARR